MPTLEALPPTSASPILKVSSLNAGYGSLQVLWNISLEVECGEFVALVGPNGAGKTTLLRAISGLLQPKSGAVRLAGRNADALPTSERVRLGMGFISEHLNLFLTMSVYENLLLGAFTVTDPTRVRERSEFVLELFPVLKERLRQYAGTLSGGERRMLGIARALMSRPKLLLVDEPSLGLAPKLVEQVFRALEGLNRRGLAILLAEQNVNRALGRAKRAYVLEHGNIFLEGSGRDLLKTDHVRKSYLGLV